MAFCGNCGARLADDAKFCEVCGAKVEQEDDLCIKCGRTLPEGAKFCPICGAETGAVSGRVKQPSYVPQSNMQRQNMQGGGFVVPDSPASQHMKRKSNGGCTGCGCGCAIILVIMLLAAAGLGLIYASYLQHGGPSIESVINAANVSFADFDYFYEDQLVNGVPEDAETVTDKAAIGGIWKMTAYIDPNSENAVKKLAVLTLVSENGEAACIVSWRKMLDAQGNGRELRESVSYEGKLYDNSVMDVKAEDGSTITISRFYRHNGKMYALGSGNIDGKDALVAFTK